jgi:hypothetical protein
LLLDKKQNTIYLLETFTETLQNFGSVENVEADSNLIQLKVYSLFIAAIH